MRHRVNQVGHGKNLVDWVPHKDDYLLAIEAFVTRLNGRVGGLNDPDSVVGDTFTLEALQL